MNRTELTFRGISQGFPYNKNKTNREKQTKYLII